MAVWNKNRESCYCNTWNTELELPKPGPGNYQLNMNFSTSKSSNKWSKKSNYFCYMCNVGIRKLNSCTDDITASSSKNEVKIELFLSSAPHGQ